MQIEASVVMMGEHIEASMLGTMPGADDGGHQAMGPRMRGRPWWGARHQATQR